MGDDPHTLASTTPFSDGPLLATAPRVTPDGRFWWNGTGWMPLDQPVKAGGPIVVVAAKNPGIHLLASAIVPGLGSVLAGRTKRGLGILFGVALIWAVALLVLFSLAPLPACITTTTGATATSTCTSPAIDVAPAWVAGFAAAWVLILGLWISGLVDAYRAAQAWNRRRGIES